MSRLQTQHELGAIKAAERRAMSDKPRTTKIRRQALLDYDCLEPDGWVAVIELESVLDLLERWHSDDMQPYQIDADETLLEDTATLLREHGRLK